MKPVKPTNHPPQSELVNSDPSVHEIAQMLVRYEKEQAKKQPYKYDCRARTTLVKANGVIYTY